MPEGSEVQGRMEADFRRSTKEFGMRLKMKYARSQQRIVTYIGADPPLTNEATACLAHSASII